MWRFPVALIALAGLLACAPAEADLPVNVPVPGADYLGEDIPPCTPVEGSDNEPCGVAPELASSIGDSGSGVGGSGPRSIESYMNDTLYGEQLKARAHLVVRGTYLPNTVRCTVVEALERPWRSPTYPYVSPSISHERARYLNCYADVRVNSYIVGTGPSQLPILLVGTRLLGYSKDDAKTIRDEAETALIRGGWARHIRTMVTENGILGREGILFLDVAFDFSQEVLTVTNTWGLEKRADDTVIAVHPHRTYWTYQDDYESKYRSKVEIPLAAFTREAQRVQAVRLTANGGRIGPAATLPKYIVDANKLWDYHVQAGNTTHADGPPVKPPPPCGRVVANQLSTPQLLLDCISLLESKDTLRGAGSLNWSVDLSIASWDGVSTDGGASGSSTRSATPATKVTKVELVNKGLTGSVPEELKDVGLTTLKLSGNTLTGCIPPELRDVETNDLSTLNLLYCDPGRPTLTAGTPDASSLALSWTAVPDTQAYRLEYIVDAQDEEWVEVSDSLTATSHTITTLRCGTDYAFRVSALGSGTGTAATWSPPSLEVLASTTVCKPVFGQDSYAFEVVENAGSYAVVGTVVATASYADAVTYRIIGGNSEGKFSIDANAGFIVVRQKLDYETTSAFALIVEASDGEGGTTNVVVTITVTDVAE